MYRLQSESKTTEPDTQQTGIEVEIIIQMKFGYTVLLN